MLVKDITYTDIDDVQQTKKFWFSMSRAELKEEILVGGRGGETFMERINRLSKTTEEDLKQGQGRELMDTFKAILAQSVGRRDGQLFIKDETTRNNFLYSGAYDALFEEMLESKDSGASLIAGILPKNMQEDFNEAAKVAAASSVVEGEVLQSSGTIEQVAQPSPTPSTGTDDSEMPLWYRENRYATPKELMNASTEETRLAMKMKSDKAFG